MALLSDLVAACDEAADQHGVEKVRTIGSSYLAVSGLSVERPDHTARMVEFAREVVRIVSRFNAERGKRTSSRRSASTPARSSAAWSGAAASSTTSGATR